MNGDTICLLKECNAGCKMATNSMEQVLPVVNDINLIRLIGEYNEKHVHLGDECHELLNECGQNEKDPSPMATAISWVTIEAKLLIKEDSHQIAELLIDGCNMGIKSVAAYLNKYSEADVTSVNIARKLMKTEQNYMKDLLDYL